MPRPNYPRVQISWSCRADFSYGDYLRCGAIAARAPIMNAVRAFAAKGGLVLGVCNGFQILCESGLLPGVLIPLHTSIREGKKILLEGAQGFALDIDHGTYPFVTSSNPTIGGALVGTGLNASNIDEVIGITKAYVTRVGEGPFPTETTGEDGDRMRVNGAEFGSTTGRPRRCGWFDVPLLKQSCQVNGLTSVVLTKLDVLSGFEKIKVAVGYTINGEKIDYFPAANLHKVEPVYRELKGWNADISRCRNKAELPRNAQRYIDFLESKIGVKISIISVGPDRLTTFKNK